MSETLYTSQELFLPEKLLSRLMNDESLLKEVLEACLPDLVRNNDAFENQMNSGDFPEATRTIHTIKGSAQNADLKRLALLSRDIETALSEGRTENAQSLKAELSRVVGETVQEVEGYLLKGK